MKKVHWLLAHLFAFLTVVGALGVCVLLLGYLVRGIIAVWTF